MSDLNGRAAIVIRGSKNGPWRLDLDHPMEIERVLGQDLLIAFAMCFVGVDRIVALRQLYLLNAKHGGADRNHAKERNGWLVLILLTGTMHELGKALDRLQAILGRSNRRTLPSWQRMMEIRRRWHTERIGAIVRHQLAHHLGDDKLYKKGLAAMVGRPSLSLYSADGQTMGEGAFEGAWDLITAGLEFEAADYFQIFDETVKDTAEVDTVMFSVFHEVVVMAGIPVEDQRSD